MARVGGDGGRRFQTQKDRQWKAPRQAGCIRQQKGCPWHMTGLFLVSTVSFSVFVTGHIILLL